MLNVRINKMAIYVESSHLFCWRHRDKSKCKKLHCHDYYNCWHILPLFYYEFSVIIVWFQNLSFDLQQIQYIFIFSYKKIISCFNSSKSSSLLFYNSITNIVSHLCSHCCHCTAFLDVRYFLQSSIMPL